MSDTLLKIALKFQTQTVLFDDYFYANIILTPRQLQCVETPGDPLRFSNTTETLEQKKTTSVTPMNQETGKCPAPTNLIVSFILGLSWDYNRGTHRHAIKEDNKVVNRDCVNHQACRLSDHIYIIACAFISHDNFF